MLLEALALGAVGLASDVPENTSILPWAPPRLPPFNAPDSDVAALDRPLRRALPPGGL